MNPLMSNQILQQFMQFRQNYKGDAKAEIQNLLNSGRISQADYDRAVQMARQLQQMLPPSVHR